MTRHMLALLVRTSFQRFSAELPYLHEICYGLGIMQDHDIASLRKLERLPHAKLASDLGSIIRITVEESSCEIDTNAANDLYAMLFGLDGVYTAESLSMKRQFTAKQINEMFSLLWVKPVTTKEHQELNHSWNSLYRKAK